MNMALLTRFFQNHRHVHSMCISFKTNYGHSEFLDSPTQNFDKKTFILVFILIFSLGPLNSLAAKNKKQFQLEYTVRFDHKTSSAHVNLKLKQHSQLVRFFRFNIDPKKYSQFKGNGKIQQNDNKVSWYPPEKGGELNYILQFNSRRKSGRFDALITPDWAIIRGDDLIPAAYVDVDEDIPGKAKLKFILPKGWTVETPYPRYTSGVFKIDRPERQFDRPVGWILAGKLGTRRETIAGTKVTVAAPLGQKVRRMDILAFLNWNLPIVRDLVPSFPEKFLIVSAGDPMWRGALSGPNSIFLHADRPLISENGTSTVAHELIHVATRTKAEPGADWIVEGLAEYYSLEILRRSGTITASRYDRALKKLAKWANQAEKLDADRSHGPITARAVGVLQNVDREIRNKTSGDKSLDDVVRDLTKQNKKLTLKNFRTTAEKIANSPLVSLSDENLSLKSRTNTN